MKEDTIVKAINMLNQGYNLNQVASILTVDRMTLMDAINGHSGISAPAPKKQQKPTTNIEPLFEEEPGL